MKTSLGDIRGRVVSAPLGGVTDVTVDQYLGIPFALPPVGELRYADPVSLSRFPLGTLTQCAIPPQAVHYAKNNKKIEKVDPLIKS